MYSVGMQYGCKDPSANIRVYSVHTSTFLNGTCSRHWQCEVVTCLWFHACACQFTGYSRTQFPKESRPPCFLVGSKVMSLSCAVNHTVRSHQKEWLASVNRLKYFALSPPVADMFLSGRFACRAVIRLSATDVVLAPLDIKPKRFYAADVCVDFPEALIITMPWAEIHQRDSK